MRNASMFLIGALALGIIYVLVRRPSAAPKNVTGPSTSNAVFGVFGSIGSSLVSKVAPPGGNQPIGPDTTGGLNSLSSDQYDALASVDQEQGVQGPF